MKITKAAIVLSVLFAMCTTTWAQISFMGKGVKTTGETTLFIDYWTRTKPNCYEISHYFDYDIAQGEGSYFVVLSVKEEDIYSFKKSIFALRDKYAEWVETAKRNNVSDVEKQIPVSIAPVELRFSHNEYQGEGGSITPIFRVNYGDPVLLLRFKGSILSDTWIFHYPEELDFILEGFDEVYNVRTAQERDKRNTESLFN